MNGSPKPKSMIVAGVMSGTSADGVDVALCRIAPGTTDSPRIKFLGLSSFPYPKAVRAELLRIMGGAPTTAADMSRLNWRLGQIYAQCVEKTATKFAAKIALVGLHGQTIHHETTPTRHLGSVVRSTWQIGEAAVVAVRLRCPVVSDFRPADLAAGGQGAPLVPMLDWCAFRSPTKSRVLLNLGGIANLTVLPAACKPEQILAFDTGPANMVIDALMQTRFGKSFDLNGTTASRGKVDSDVLAKLMRNPYFSAPPPKSCGREQFGAAFAEHVRSLCARRGANNPDIIATATALTIASVLDAYQRFCIDHLKLHAPGRPIELIAAGGGTRNRTIMNGLRAGLAESGVNLLLADKLGIPSQAKEGVAFALLAWLTWHGLPSNIPSATGATRPVVLGKVSHPG